MGRSKIKAKRTKVDGIEFASRLEAYTYKALKQAGVEFEYEGRSFVIVEGIPKANSPCTWEFKYKKYKERQAPTKPITYTPDFVPKKGAPVTWIIECKGRANESFPMRWKLFKMHIAKTFLFNKPILFMPHTYKDVDVTVQEILKL
jgi:hypothetical protein